jgi:general stress protein 26
MVNDSFDDSVDRPVFNSSSDISDADSVPESRDEKIAQLAKMIKGIRIAMLTTLDPDGVLRSRPMATQEQEYDGDLWFVTRNESGKVRSIANDQHVNLGYSDNDGHRYVSISGHAQLTDNREKIHELWTPMLKAWFPDGPDDPSIMLIKVEVDSCEYWDSPGGAFVQLAGMAKAYVTGQAFDENMHHHRIDLGTH